MQRSALVDALDEPMLLVSDSGVIQEANRAALRLFGGAELIGLHVTEPHDVSQPSPSRYLARCKGSAEPLMGRVAVPGASQGTFPSKGNRVQFADCTSVLLRLPEPATSRFEVLTTTIAELEAELKRRRNSEALLRESVLEKNLLLQELEHRVKNNMQMLTGLLSAARRDATSEETKHVLQDALARFSAISAVQQLLYHSGQAGTIDAGALVDAIVEGVTAMSIESPETTISVDPLTLPADAAVPIGLILNELATNAVKYGQPSMGTQQISITLRRQGEGMELSVEDNGPGFTLTHARKRASGHGLIRGLLRQLGGTMEIDQSVGARCTIRLPTIRYAILDTRS